MEQRLLALGALLLAACWPCRGAPTPPPPRCPQATPPGPAPTPPPLPPDCDPAAEVATSGGEGGGGEAWGGHDVTAAPPADVTAEETNQLEATRDPRDASGPGTAAPPRATSQGGPLGTSQGGDGAEATPPADVTAEGTNQLEATQKPGTTLDPVTQDPPDATTGVGPSGTSEGGDKVLVATPGEVTMKGTKELEATQDPKATLDPVTQDPCDATTPVRPSGTSQGGDKVLVATPGDVPTEGTKQLEATQDPGTTLDSVTKALCDATTPVGPSGTSQGGDKVLVATPRDVTMEGTEELETTQDPKATLDPVTQDPCDATTPVGPSGTSQGGDKVLVATPGDVTMEGTKELEATQDPKATLDLATEAPPDATTPVGPSGTSQGGDKVLVATPRDVTMEGTKELEATQDPGTTLDPVTEAPPDATTLMGPSGTSQGGDKELVATPGDVTMEGTKELEATQDPGTTLDPVTEAPSDATTPVGPSGTSPGGDKVLVATPGDVTMEGTKELEATQDPKTSLDPVTEAPPDATTLVGPLGTSQGGDKVLVATPGEVPTEGTKELEATQGPQATQELVPKASPDGSSVVCPQPTSPGGGSPVVATPGGVLLEGTAQPGVSSATTPVAVPTATTPPGGARGAVTPGEGTQEACVTPGGQQEGAAPQGGVLVEGTALPGATTQLGDGLDPLTEVPPGATAGVGPSGTSQGGEGAAATTPGEVPTEGTEQLEATQEPKATLDPVTAAPPDATTPVGPSGTSQGGDKVLVATPGDVTTEGTEQLEATQDPGSTLDPVTQDPPDATSPVGPSETSQGGDKVLVATPGDVTMKGTEQLEATQDPGTTLGADTEAPPEATTRVGPSGPPQGGDKAMVTPGGDLLLGATQAAGASSCLQEAPGGERTTLGADPRAQGCDSAGGAQGGDPLPGGSAQPAAASGPGDTPDPVTSAPPAATTPVGPSGTSPGGAKVLVATPGEVPTEGTEQLEATRDPKAALDPTTAAPPDATTGLEPSGTPQGEGRAAATPPADVTAAAANQPQATQAPPALAPKASAAAAATAGDVMMQAPPLGCGHALPVTLEPPAGVAKGGSAPRPSAGFLLLLPLPLLLR